MVTRPRPAEVKRSIRKGKIGGKRVMVYKHEGTQVTVMENPEKRGWPLRDDLYRLYVLPKGNGGGVLMMRKAESVDWNSGGRVRFSNRGEKTIDPRHLEIYKKYGRRKVKLARE